MLKEIMSDYDQAKADASFDDGHPIFQMAQHIDNMKEALQMYIDAQKVLEEEIFKNEPINSECVKNTCIAARIYAKRLLR